MNYNTNFIGLIAEKLTDIFSIEEIELIKKIIFLSLEGYKLVPVESSLAVLNETENEKAIRMFFISKKMEGCTEKTLEYYSGVIRRFFSIVTLPLESITSDDIRIYLAKRSINDKLSKCSQDNELRTLKSFFKWCSGEGYISKIPTVNIKSIKKEKRIKKPFSEIEIEMLRQQASLDSDKIKAARNLAIIDVLFSTGVRVSELVAINDEDLQGDEITVFGKGEKERVVYLNAKALLSLKKYNEIKKIQDSEALFVSVKKPYARMSAGSVELMLRELGKAAKINNVHPHRFRRTAATIALNRGMPIEQVALMLGHENIETTTIYARSEKENVKASHRKYVV